MMSTELDEYVKRANEGCTESVRKIMDKLDSDMTLEASRQLDYALSKITLPECVEVIKEYLFHGSQIQRNYAALYFGRIHEYFILREAYDKGLIDEKQAFSR